MAFLLMPESKAVPYACSESFDIDESGCPEDPDTPPNKIQSCSDACKEAKQPCEKAGEACKEAKAGEQKANSDAANSSNAANNSSNGNQGQNGGQGGSQGPNASNMCGGQDAAKNAGDAGTPVQPAMAKCAEKAAKCTGKGTKAAQQAIKDGADTAAKAAKHLADAAQMGKKCDQSKANEDKMPQMPQIPQMPQQEKKADNQTPQADPSTIASGSDTNTNTDTTAKVDTVNFGNATKNGIVDVTPGKPPSGLTGAQASGHEVGAGANGPGLDRNNDGFNGGKIGSPSAGGTYNPSGGGGGSPISSTGASKSKDGIAAADIKPETFEVNPSAGKSVLGLKGKGGEDDELAGIVAQPNKGGTFGNGNDKNSRGPSGSGASAGSAMADDGASLFFMVRNRYKNLRELGKI